ncbi:DNA recombination protein RmuC [Psychromonas sp. MME2]|uniref:DNA recombination protein RmuC n=1 Tax=unclassified Psychromonas TaxID=2614957 RepID=UPI00339CCD93
MLNFSADSVVIILSITLGCSLLCLLWFISSLKKANNALNVKLELSNQALQFQSELNQQQTEQLQEKQLFIDSLQLQTNKLTTRLRETEIRLQSGEQRLRDHQFSEEKLSQQFELLSQRIFNDKSAQFKAINQESLNQLLNPFKTQLDEFKKQVSDCYLSESKERYQLQNEVSKLATLNEKMQQETINLTNALKGDNKQQGNWGEVVLQRILQSSGLREGHEYHTQVSLKNEHGQRLQPDVIVNLPGDRTIIIDSKVSLVAYERFFNAENSDQQKQALQAHIISMRQHIKGLGKKDYQKLISTNSLDYVLLFVAVEPAFISAIEHDPELVKLALDNNILLASPTNLMIALRTIENLWRFDQQEKNGRLIANQAGKLYDKLRLFSQNMLDLGAQLGKAQSSYDHALKQLSEGRGNVISQTEALRDMGVPIKQPLPERLVERAQRVVSINDAKNEL